MRARKAVFPSEAENGFEYSSPARPAGAERRRQRRWLAPFLCVFGFAAAAALSVSALLARADLTVLQDECERLEQSIVELSEVHDHLVIERESRPGALSAGQEAEQAPAEDWAEVIRAPSGGDASMDKISDVISFVSEYFARSSQ